MTVRKLYESKIMETENNKNAVVLIGLQGSGKSTFYNKHFQNYIHISLDELHTRNKEMNLRLFSRTAAMSSKKESCMKFLQLKKPIPLMALRFLAWICMIALNLQTTGNTWGTKAR